MTNTRANHTVFIVNKNHKVVALTKTVDSPGTHNYRTDKAGEYQNLQNDWKQKYPNIQLQEISTASQNPLNQKISAFNLKYVHDGKTYPIENLFQGGKIYDHNYQNENLIDPNVSAKDAKRAANPKYNQKIQGKDVTGFKLFSQKFSNQPRTFFYNWLYCSAMYQPQNKQILDHVTNSAAFSDIHFNINQKNHRVNCQAQACGIMRALHKSGQLDQAMQSPNDFKKIVYGGGMLLDHTKTAIKEVENLDELENNNDQKSKIDQPKTFNDIANDKNRPKSKLKPETKPFKSPLKPIKNTKTDPNFKPGSNTAKLIRSIEQLPGVTNQEIVDKFSNMKKEDRDKLDTSFETLKSLQVGDVTNQIYAKKLTPEKWSEITFKTDKEFETAQQEQIHIVDITNPNYPDNIKKSNVKQSSKPNIVYIKGDPTVFNKTPLVGIYGDMDVDPFAHHINATYDKSFTDDGYNIATSTDTNLDRQTHINTMINNKKPVTIFNGSLDQISHHSNELKNDADTQIIENNGTIISNQPIDETKKYKSNDSKQNQFEAMLLDGAIGVEGDKNNHTINILQQLSVQQKPIAVPNLPKYANLPSNKNPYKIFQNKTETYKIATMRYHAQPLFTKNSLQSFKDAIQTTRQQRLNIKNNNFKKTNQNKTDSKKVATPIQKPKKEDVSFDELGFD